MAGAIDFSWLGDLGNVYREGRIAAARKSLGGAFSSGKLDYGEAARRLAEAGDMEGATTFARLGEAAGYRAEDRAWRKQEANRSQMNADRAFGLQERQLEDKPSITWQEDETGKKIPYVVNAPKGVIAPISVPGVTDTAQGNPFSTGKMNDTQSKDALYASRMMDAEAVLRDKAVIDAGLSNTQKALSRAPYGVGNYLVSEDFQKLDQAQRNFINATLRRESGAVISENEFDNARKQYFPEPGDGPGKLAQKQANRAEAIRGIAGAAGPSYRPPYTFDEAGNLVKVPGARPGTVASRAPPAAAGQPIPPATPAVPLGGAQAGPQQFTKQQVIEEARRALMPRADGRRKDPALIAKKMREMGIDPAEIGLR